MADVQPRQNRFVRFVEAAPYPSLLLLIPIVLIYGGSLRWGFMLDDFRHLHVIEQYQSGERDNLHLFRFLTSPDANAAARRDGSHPWWLSDDVRYQHWRPAAEWMLYGEYLVFGRHPFGYHAITLLAYWLGAWLIYRFFCHLAQSERVARWGALAFTVFACHAIPTVFISAQADVVVLALCAGLMLMAMRCATSGAYSCLFPMAVLFLLSLGFKEACLPVAILPAVIGVVACKGAPRRKLVSASALLLLIGLGWMWMYAQGGFGSNTLVMLDPIRRPMEYLWALPGRAILLLTSLVIPVNPFVFYLRPRGEPFIYAYCAIGLIVLIATIRAIARRASGDRVAPAMALWTLAFVPLLVCTVPDDRVLMLPSIGFAYLVGVWIAGARANASPRIRRAPVWIFFGAHLALAFGSAQVMRLVELRTIANHKNVAKLVGPHDANSVVFFLDSKFDLQVLFAQRIFRDVNQWPDAGLRFLSDSEALTIRRTARNRLELTDHARGFFASFIGDMAVTRAHPKRVGDVFEAGEVTGRILNVEDGVVRAVELTFRRDIDDPAYHFFTCGVLGKPEPWKVPPVAD
ncbi:MAG TPA: hypothetical protein P5081_22335 [Phycisphaerae bacterium]|nr:hypothetical protein [Phycisphaerae bacterium]HRW55620.1 hypothetical protein [Phycisphaerae bacterium]